MLTVVSGAADMTVLKEGATATITAKAAQTGYAFSSWTVSGSGSVANTASATTTYTMGAGDATVTANYVPVSYTLNVKNGSGSGSYNSGEWVDISADYPENGKEFDSWTVKKGDVIIDDPSDYYAGFTMPASDATVKATYHNGPDPNSNAITGLENDKQYLKGTTLSFTAVGAGMDKEGRNPGDYRYKPTGYQISGVTGSWSSSPYTTSMAINAAGDYTLTVSLRHSGHEVHYIPCCHCDISRHRGFDSASSAGCSWYCSICSDHCTDRDPDQEKKTIRLPDQSLQ